MILVIGSGLLLQVKKQVPWVQPPSQRGAEPGASPKLDWDDILRIASADENAQIRSWEDVDRLDVRLDRGIVKVRSRTHWELQIDLSSEAVLSSTARNSDWIESLHDGSFFGDAAKLWLFLPNGLILFGLWFTGLYLWWLPWQSRRKKKQTAQLRQTNND